MRRALYLEQNWRRQNPVGSHSRFQTLGRPVVLKMLPGGKYMVSVIKNLELDKYTLVLWDLDHAGARVPLTGAMSTTPFLKLEVKYAAVKGFMCIVIAYAKPPVKKDNVDSTQVRVVCAPLTVLEDLSGLPGGSDLFDESLELPFHVLHESWTTCDVGQLALECMQSQLVLLVVHRPRALVFHYLESGKRGNLLLGPVHPYTPLRHSIWSVKLMPGQNSVLVSRVLIEVGVNMDSTLFVLDLFMLPGPGSSYKHPMNIGRQVISGLHVDGFYFSDLETSWFNSMHCRDGLLPVPGNFQPPPLSIFLTTRNPRGFLHCLLPPVPVPNEVVKLPHGRGWANRYCYQLPAAKVERHTWGDEYARPVILPGAYRSLVLMRPHLRPELQKEGDVTAGAMEVLRFCTFATKAEGYDKFATPRTLANFSEEEPKNDPDAMQVEEDQPAPVVEPMAVGKRSLCIPDIPSDIAWKMMHGTTSLAFDESVGKLCVGTTGDTDVHVLDFGGENWEVPLIQP
ncbi:hypothetical protein JB92DRAFT_2851183 [Gautieria morchelliformis]|nr:hypothetical protein JB92DRAFT_2851183 [Gautieria morchelliformis]